MCCVKTTLELPQAIDSYLWAGHPDHKIGFQQRRYHLEVYQVQAKVSFDFFFLRRHLSVFSIDKENTDLYCLCGWLRGFFDGSGGITWGEEQKIPTSFMASTYVLPSTTKSN